MVKNPVRVASGTIQLAMIGASIYFAVQASPAVPLFIAAHKIAIISGAALAAI
jgi:hypothetical protein